MMRRLPNGDFVGELEHINVMIAKDDAGNDFINADSFWQELPPEIEDENVEIKINETSVDLLFEEVQKEEKRLRSVGENVNIRDCGTSRSTFFFKKGEKRKTEEVALSINNNIKLLFCCEFDCSCGRSNRSPYSPA